MSFLLWLRLEWGGAAWAPGLTALFFASLETAVAQRQWRPQGSPASRASV